MSIGRTHCRPVIVVIALLSAMVSTSAIAQQENPVYVDDSPQAWELFRRAADQVRENTAESVRLYQELLDDFGLKLIPAVANEPDYFASVRRRVLVMLRSDQRLLERYRQMQTPQAQQMLEAGYLQKLARTRPLTEPGLEAMLRLAQDDLEAARFHSALVWLDQALNHPDLASRRAAHAHFMRGLALHNLHDQALVQQEAEALAELGAEGEPFRAQLEHLVAPNDQPAIVWGISTMDRAHATDLNDLVAQAIWSMPLEDSLLRRRFSAPGLEGEQFRNNFPQRVQEADLATSIATATPSSVFVNEGNMVMALSRLTGRKLWSYTDQPRLELVDREAEPPLDLNIVAVSGDSLVTLTGHANAGARSSQGQIVCLDAVTGSPRWTNDLRKLSDAAGGGEEDLFPHGAPVIADGLVFVAARRVSQQLLTSAYVVALDLNDGHLRWSQYVSSSGGLRASPRPFCSLVWAAGSLFVASPVGAIARLDPASGEIFWLRRYNVPLSQPIMDQARRPWELTAPVVTRRGVVAIEPDQRRIILLDLETGTQLESYSATSSDGWYTPRYLLADEQRVYGVGTEVRGFDIDALEHPAWRLPPAQVQQRAPDQPAPVSEPLEIRGRVQLVDDALVIPTSKGILVVNDETGIIKHRLPVENPGNPLAVDAQLVLACADRVDSYMSFARAERMLRDRIAQAPNEPEPALSLLRLGMKVRNLSLALEAADLSIQAINQMIPAGGPNANQRKPADARAELFTLMLDLAAARIAETDEQGESIFAVTDSVALDAGQRVEYLLRYGDWLAGHAVERSIETYQAILSDPILSATPRFESGVTCSAAQWTTDHLRRLIVQRGATVYAPQADYSRTRLAELLSDPEGDPAELGGLSQEFPFAEASAEAAVVAADRYSKRHQPRLALAVLMDAINVVTTPPVNSAITSKLLGAYARIAQDTGWIHQAAAALRLAIRLKIDGPLSSDAGSRTARQWLANLGDGVSRPPSLPSIGDPTGIAKDISGAIVPAHDHRDGALPLDRVLLRDGASLKLIAADTLEPKWTSTIETDLPEILRFDDGHILLWMGADPEDPKAILLNAANGMLKWTTPNLNTVLPADAGRDLGNIRGVPNQMPDGEPFDPRQTLPLVNGGTLMLLQRTGAVVCFDLPRDQPLGDAPPAAGGVRWTRVQTLDQIHLAKLTDFGLVLIGRTKPSDRDEASRGESALLPAIMVLNPMTGEPLYPDQPIIRPLGRGGVKWFSIDPFGSMVCASVDGLQAIDLLSGRTLWSNTSYGALDSQHGWSRDQRLVIEDRRARLRLVDLQGGAVSEQFDVPTRTEWDPMDLRGVLLTDDRAVVHYRQRVVMYDYKGTVAGYDVVTDDRDYRWLLAAADRFLAISGKTEQAPVPDQAGRRMQYTYRIYAMSDNGKVLGEPWALQPLGERVQQTMLLNNRLLLSTQSDTRVMPMGK